MFNDNRFHQQGGGEAIDENTTLFEIIDNNNTLFLSGFENDTEKKYEINERIIKESFKMSILSNLQGFYDSPIHNSNSFILFAGIPIEKLCIKNSIIYSTNNPIFGKLLFEAFIEYLEVLKKDEQDIQSYIEYFQLIFSPTNLSLYPKDENFIYDEEGDVIQINDGTIGTDEFNEQNLFNYLYIEDTINILHKLSHNLETGNNFLWQLMREFILKINNDSEEKTKDLLRHYLQKGKEELMYFMISLMGYNNIIGGLDTSKIELFEKIFSEIDTAMSQYFKELTHIQINNDDQNLIKYSNKFNTEKESIGYQVGTKDPTLLTFKVSKDNTVFTSTSGKYAGYGEYTEEPFNGEQYITYCLAVFINNLKQGHSLDSLFNFLDAELHFAIKKESHKNIFEYIENIIGKKGAFFIQKKFEGKTSHEDFQNFMQELSQIEQISYQPTNIVPKRSISEIMESLDIYGNLNKEYFEKILEIFHTTDLINIVSYDLQIDITNLTLQTQVHLLRFLWEQTTEKFKEFKQTLLNIPEENQKYNFLTTFLACSQDLSMGDKIIELANRDGTEEIFQTYAELVELQNEVNQDDIDSIMFLKVILSRGKEMIESGEITERASKEIVEGGAFIKAFLAKDKSGEIMSIEDFNKNPYFKVEKFSLAELPDNDILIQSDNELDMLNEENYFHPEIFSKDDYIMLYRNFQEAYGEIDKGWLGVLIRGIIKELKDKKSTLYIMRDKKTNSLSSLCKIKDDGHFGTHYVDSVFRKDFGFGGYIGSLAMNDTKNLIIHGTVAKNNTSLERHINYGGFISDKILYESDEKGTSKELINITQDTHTQGFSEYKTKDKIKYPDSKLKSTVGKNIDYEVLLLDSRLGYDEIFIEELSKRFNSGYCITRLFYEKEGTKSNLKKTYIVFQKKIGNNIQSSSEEKIKKLVA